MMRIVELNVKVLSHEKRSLYTRHFVLEWLTNFKLDECVKLIRYHSVISFRNEALKGQAQKAQHWAQL